MCGIVGAVAQRDIVPILIQVHSYRRELSHTVDTFAGRDAANAAPGDDFTGLPRRSPR
ncbi:hypothetical protein [Burkholderia cepacia]|uniref:Uncharacterized protein n=1 Tax=Burkholderia cepacia GG4 TaxID=1009846 RepID=A0A9W3PC93_BURCE|nr:hypothetical protein [Burkholderia cepacia]AFQ51405.1 hypothetical protein GEM_5018 [Burkholderia cepacia GG4]